MNFGENLKMIRKKKGLSQRELGEKLGITQQTVAQYEKLKSPPKYETLHRIAESLNIRYTDFLPEFTDEDQKIIKELIDIPELKSNNIYNISPESIAKMHLSLSTANLHLDAKKKLLLESYDSLNSIGQDKAIDQVKLLTKIPEYQKDADE